MGLLRSHARLITRAAKTLGCGFMFTEPQMQLTHDRMKEIMRSEPLALRHRVDLLETSSRAPQVSDSDGTIQRHNRGRFEAIQLIIIAHDVFPIGRCRVRRGAMTCRDASFEMLMVNLLWALHIPLLMRAPIFLALSLGIALGLQWMAYSWIISDPLGYVHALLRTIGLVSAWFFFPQNVVAACAAVIVFAYCATLYQMAAWPTE